jgi:hypothetical protein
MVEIQSNETVDVPRFQARCQAGTYLETVIPPRDRLTYDGERGPNNEWRTIIDPSKPVLKWTQAPPDIGANIWQLKLGYLGWGGHQTE